MLESLITSRTRVRLLLKFFVNSESKAYLRSLAKEFGESTNAVRLELNRLTEAGLLVHAPEGRTKVYRANPSHPLYEEIRRMAQKTLGLDQIAEKVVSRLGEVELALVIGDYARGADSGVIDLVLVGNIDTAYYYELAEKVEKLLGRKLRALFLTPQEFAKLKGRFEEEGALVLWEKSKKEEARP